MDEDQKKVLKIVMLILVILIVMLVILFFYKDNIIRKVPFVPPEYEVSSIEGKPEIVDETLTYQEMTIKDNYIVSLCATPKIENGILTLYFTSDINSKDLLRIRIVDKDENILAESGLIEPNSYIKEIELNRELVDNEFISIKVMSYEKDTYYSNGSFKLNVFVKNDSVKMKE